MANPLSVAAGEKPFDTIEDLVQDGLITLYMEANNVEDYLQSARRRTRHLTSSTSSYCSLPSTTSTALPRPHPQASAMVEPLIEEVEAVTPSPPPVVPTAPSLPRRDRERSSSASSGPSDHEHAVHLERPPRTYDEVEDVTLASGTGTTRQTVSTVRG